MIMTKAAFAERMGVDRAQPTRWAARGMSVLPDGRVDVDAAEAWVARTIDSTQRRSHGRKRAPLAPVVIKPPFDCMAHLTDPADQIAVLLSMVLAYRFPASASVMAIGAGASVGVAREMLSAVQISVMQDVEDALDHAGIPPPPGCDTWDGASIWDVDRFVGVNWPAMEKAVAARAPGWTPDWKLTEATGSKPARSRRRAGK